MRIKRINNIYEIMEEIKPDLTGKEIMKAKTQIIAFKISNLNKVAVQILKQDALSLGAELVTPKNAILGDKEYYDCLLFGSLKSLRCLSKKLLLQSFGLKEIAKDLQIMLKNKIPFKKKIMSIINIESKSFYEELSSKNAIDRIFQDIEDGADIIDIGAVSTSPNSPLVSYEEELKRLKNIFDEIKKISSNVVFSIDTYNLEVAKEAINIGFKIINDVSANPHKFEEILKYNNDIAYVLTHSRGVPSNMQNMCEYENLVLEIDNFFTEKLTYLDYIGFKNAILDVGIGFAKKCNQNLELLKNLKHFSYFDKELLIGVSNKSFIGEITKSSTNDRLSGTLISGFYALQNGASILRVHNVKEHKKLLDMFWVLN